MPVMKNGLVSSRNDFGFSMVEVLVTILIVSFGLLGIAGMLSASINAGQVSMHRSNAVTLANEMADRIRSNWRGVKDGAFDAVLVTTNADAAACNVSCMSAQCSPVDQAALDVCLWKKQLQKQLPGGQGSIASDGTNLLCANPGAACTFIVTVTWTEANYKTGTNANLVLLDPASRNYAVRVQP